VTAVTMFELDLMQPHAIHLGRAVPRCSVATVHS
jgi:hypothetical protein